MNGTQTRRRIPFGRVALVISLAATVGASALPTSGDAAAGAADDPNRFAGQAGGRIDLVAAIARVADTETGAEDVGPSCAELLARPNRCGGGSGAIDPAAEIGKASWADQELRASSVGDAWASTRQYPGKPY